MIRFYNTLTKTKEDFVPLREGVVAMYVCGPTVYDLGHLGHGRSAVVFDVIRRYLVYRGFQVNYVSNYTDIDDKMINRASEKGISVAELAESIIPQYTKDFSELRVLPADVHPKATDYVKEMIALILELEKKHATYVIADGVYFDVRCFPEYGKLSGQQLEELQAGARVALKDEKRSSSDFVLWKFEKPGEPAWDSPWGRGRPGWHIECSAMVKTVLSQPIDIHGGGLDLTFPHHECEIAQSELAYGEPFARYWMHNGFVNIDKEKMSKSLNNFITLRESFKSYPGRVIRFLYLQTHYRSPLDFSADLLEQAKSGLARIDQFMKLLERYDDVDPRGHVCEWESWGPIPVISDLTAELQTQIEACMDNDFDVSGALGILFSFITEINGLMQRYQLGIDGRDRALDFMRRIDTIFAILDTSDSSLDNEISALVAEREEARKLKNFSRSDEIRDELKARGIILEDTPTGVMWKRM